MARILFLVLATILVSTAHATTQILFTADKAIILVQGPAGDLDAPHLFNALKTNSIDNGTTLSKHITFTDSAKQNIFDLGCTLSKNVANYGSCTIQIFKVDNMVFEPNNQRVITTVQTPEDAFQVSQLFNRPDQTGFIYSSDDGNLIFSLQYNGGSYPQLFMIQYH